MCGTFWCGCVYVAPTILTDPAVEIWRMKTSWEFILQPWHLLFATFAGWVIRKQQTVIGYSHAENWVLKERHGHEALSVHTRCNFRNTLPDSRKDPKADAAGVFGIPRELAHQRGVFESAAQNKQSGDEACGE